MGLFPFQTGSFFWTNPMHEGNLDRPSRRSACPCLRVQANFSGNRIGAGSGNRTRIFSLEGCCSTIELYPHGRPVGPDGGGGWIRTSVRISGQIYSLMDLTTLPPLRVATRLPPARRSAEPARQSLFDFATGLM